MSIKLPLLFDNFNVFVITGSVLLSSLFMGISIYFATTTRFYLSFASFGLSVYFIGSVGWGILRWKADDDIKKESEKNKLLKEIQERIQSEIKTEHMRLDLEERKKPHFPIGVIRNR